MFYKKSFIQTVVEQIHFIHPGETIQIDTCNLTQFLTNFRFEEFS